MLRMRTKVFLWGGGILFLGGGLIFVLNALPAAEVVIAENPAVSETVIEKIPYLKVGAVRVPVEIADDGPEVTKGLSGRLSLPADQGMFFIFQNPDRYRFWMPDMHFPIDIIWIHNGTVIAVDPNVSNEFDPVNPKFYLPPSPVRYVLEVNAGFAAKHRIRAGTPVELHLDGNF